MKIALIITDYDSEAGIPKFTRILAESFSKKNDVHVFSNSFSKYKTDKIKFKRILKHTGRIPFFSNHVFFKTLFFAISSNIYCRKKDFDIILSPAGQTLRCDIVSAHGCYRVWRDIQKKEGKLKHQFDPVGLLVNELERQIYNNSKKIIAISNWMKNEILEYYHIDKDKILVISPGIDIHKYRFNIEKRRAIRKKLNLKANELVLVFSGREFARKGVRYIIDALPYLDCKLIVIGKADPYFYKKRASELGVNDKIIFTGFVEKIEDYYSAGDIFILPSLHEEFSQVSLEALSSSLPVLITDVGGAKDVIENGRNGFIIRRNKKDIVTKIRSITPDKLNKMRKEARRSVLAYSFDEAAKKYLEVFEEVLINENKKQK
ncbi:MAG: glycosyltransferase family 4 protein [Candidatus Aenigmarchaeota archaeon]|nr:glycosyltransferase family 4 protein [Candidatus Aenigmarchaeota archaeon]